MSYNQYFLALLVFGATLNCSQEAPELLPRAAELSLLSSSSASSSSSSLLGNIASSSSNAAYWQSTTSSSSSASKVNKKTIVVPKQCPRKDPIEIIDINEKETFSQETYHELITQKRNAGLPYILARVVSEDDKGEIYTHYFDAHQFNRYISQGEYPYSFPIKKDIKNLYNSLREKRLSNPSNNTSITNVHYFTIQSIDDPSFESYCSHNLLFTSANRLKHLIYFAQNYHDENETTAFFQGLQSSESKMLNEISKEILEDHQFIKAQLHLGKAYYNANDLKTSTIYFDAILKHKVAAPQKHFYFKESTNDQLSNDPITNMIESSQATAHTYLGAIYYLGGTGVDKDLATVIRHLEVAAKQTVNLNAQAEANKFLGGIYFYGDTGVEKNFATARLYLKAASEQTVNRDVQTEANEFLAKIEKNSEKTKTTHARDEESSSASSNKKARTDEEKKENK